MLTSDQIKTLSIELLLNKPITVHGLEAEEFIVKFKKDMAEAKRKGWILELPFEVPDVKS
jgi:hypothetical protein